MFTGLGAASGILTFIFGWWASDKIVHMIGEWLGLIPKTTAIEDANKAAHRSALSQKLAGDIVLGY